VSSGKASTTCWAAQVAVGCSVTLKLKWRTRRRSWASTTRTKNTRNVMEIVDRHDTNTYRAVYTAQFAGRIYVLHAFQKKSKKGIATPPEGHPADREAARRRQETLQGKAELTMKKSKTIRAEEGSGNVFADLDLPHAEQELLKARLTLQIYKIIKARGLTQAKAGEILGIKQPHVSALMRNRAGMFSVERLMEFLTHLGQDVEITVRPTRREHGKVSVVGAA